MLGRLLVENDVAAYDGSETWVDALLRDPNLFGLPITPTAHAPLWSGTPMTVEITGEVPSAAVHESVLRIAWAEAQRIRPDVEVRDRLTVRAAARVA